MKKKPPPIPRRKIDLIVIHCTATGDYPLGSLYYDRIGVKQIKQWHMKPIADGGRNFDDCGYHYVIRRTGKVEDGRPEHIVGAHCLDHNFSSIGVAWVGTEEPTGEQVKALRHLIKELLEKYGLRKENVKPHNYFNRNKLCPGIDIDEILLWDFK